MIDTRAVAQEVQEQFAAAVQRGQEQMRKSREQLRKSREAVAEVIRTGNHLAKSIRPSIPTLPKPGVQVPPLSKLASPAKLRASAQELSEQFVARQRELAEKAFHAASPIVAEGVARLTQVVGTRQPERESSEHKSTAKLTVVQGGDTSAPAEAAHVDASPAEAQADVTADAAAAQAAEPSAPTELHTAKARTAKTSTAKTSTAKTPAAKTSTAKTAAAKSSTAKAGSREGASSGKTTAPRKASSTGTSRQRTPKK